MTTKTVSMSLTLRDPEGNVIGSNNTEAHTEDDGLTITFGLGYLPGIDTAAPEDIAITVNQPAVIIPVASVSLDIDLVNEIQTLTVTPA